MKNFNRVILTGNLGNDPKMIKDGFVGISIAQSKSFIKKGETEKTTKTDWFDATAHGKTANYIGKYFKKGQRVLVEAEMYSTKNDEDHNRIGLNVLEIQSLDAPKKEETSA